MVKDPDPQPSSTLTPEKKMNICERTFHAINKGNLIKDLYLYKEYLMRDENRFIFDEIFENKRKIPLIGSKEDIYVNSSKPRPFSIAGKEYTENTFMCLNYKRGPETTHIFYHYFVSDYDYNLNEVPRGFRIEGRFIFFDGKIHGLAEKEGVYRFVVEELSLNKYYLQNRPYQPPAKKSDGDPVCQKDPLRKLRFCVHVCSYYDRFCYNEASVEECEEKNIVLEDKWFYGEWLLKCKFKFKDMYVSRGFQNNEFFVWNSRRQGEFQLYQLISNVGFVVVQ